MHKHARSQSHSALSVTPHVPAESRGLLGSFLYGSREGLHPVRQETKSGERVVTTGSTARMRNVGNSFTIPSHGQVKRSTVFLLKRKA
jgi:hypothetical protein